MKSEEWLRLAEQGSPMGLWYWNEDTGRVFWDAKACEMFGVSPHGTKSLETFYECLHPDDRERVKQVWRYELENRLPYELEYRSVWPDGTIRFIHALGNGYYDKTGKPVRMIGVVFDVTERRKAERERLELSGRLINAQEDERRRLARELHDDFGQRLAVVGLELTELEGVLDVSPADAHARVQRLIDAVGVLGKDLRSLSHRLHSAKLELLGLPASSEVLCQEFSRHQGIGVGFTTSDIPPTISSDAALCLFRVLQEALRNVGKHSGASQVEVILKGGRDTISLTVSDDGAGFGADSSVSNGIGIQSMRERVRMLSGTLDIQTRPQQGTTISVIIPCRPE